MSDRRYEDFGEEMPEFAEIGYTLKLAGILFSGPDINQLYLLPEEADNPIYKIGIGRNHSLRSLS